MPPEPDPGLALWTTNRYGFSRLDFWLSLSLFVSLLLCVSLSERPCLYSLALTTPQPESPRLSGGTVGLVGLYTQAPVPARFAWKPPLPTTAAAPGLSSAPLPLLGLGSQLDPGPAELLPRNFQLQWTLHLPLMMEATGYEAQKLKVNRSPRVKEANLQQMKINPEAQVSPLVCGRLAPRSQCPFSPPKSLCLHSSHQ